MRGSARAVRPVLAAGTGLGLALALVSLGACDVNSAQPPPKASASEIESPPPTPDQPSADGCPTFDGPTRLGTAPRLGLPEASGLAASPSHAGHWWTHNDSGSGAVALLLGPEGDLALRVRLAGAAAVDWEDMAAVTDPTGMARVYIADFGDNLERRPKVQLYRFDEPTSLEGPRQRVDATSVDLVYPDGPHNAEALLVDPRGMDVFIVTKEPSGSSKVFRARDPFAAATGGSRRDPLVLEAVGERRFGNALIRGSNLVTAGDVRPDGTGVVLRTYTGACLFERAGDEPLHEVIAGECCRIPLALEPQGEAIAFTHDGRGYATISEGNASPIWGFASTPASVVSP